MAAPVLTRFLRRVFPFKCEPLKPASSTSTSFAIIDRQWFRSLDLTTDSYANNRLHRMYSQSSNNSSIGKKPLKKPFTPVGKHDDTSEHIDAEKEPLEAFPNETNPVTGEKGGPRGPEPTRYGDWERKGRCIDF